MNILKIIAIVIGILGAAFALLENQFPDYRKDRYTEDLSNKAKQFSYLVEIVKKHDKFKTGMSDKEVKDIVRKEISNNLSPREVANGLVHYVENVIECEERYLCRIDNFKQYEKLIHGVWFLLRHHIEILVEDRFHPADTGYILKNYMKNKEKIK